MPNENCPVCEGALVASSAYSRYDERGSIQFGCPRCGEFEIADELLMDTRLKEMEEDDRMKLSAWIRTERRSDVVVTPENFSDICHGFRNYKVSEKQLLLLRHLEGLTSHPGNRVQIDLHADYPVIWAHDYPELEFHLKELSSRGFVELHGGPELAIDREWTQVVSASITGSGWASLEDHPALADVGNQVFVAMWFDDLMKSAFDKGIEPALQDAGYRAYRVDLVQHNERIDAKIEHEIQNSAFVVADVTGQRQGVYYEAGFALGLGRQVIWSVRESEIEEVHFDTRQYNHIVWTDEVQLRDDLYHRVSTLFGKSGQVRGPRTR